MIVGLKLSKEGSDTFPNPTQYRSIAGLFSMPPSPGLLFASLSTGYVTLLIHIGKQVKESYATSKAPFNLVYSSYQFLHILSLCKPSVMLIGACVFLGPNLVRWWAKKHVFSRSSTDKKYRSLALATSELPWLQFLLSE